MDGTILGKKYDLMHNGGGGGGTSDYEELSNLPKINSVELKGNKSLDDLSIQGKLTFDETPTESSNNPVKSGGVYAALPGIATAAVAGLVRPDGTSILVDANGVISANSGNTPVKMSVDVTTVSTGGDDASINISISFNNVVVSSTDYVYTVFNTIDFVPIGDFLRISYFGTNFKLTLLKDSLTHSAGYYTEWAYSDTVDLTEECYIINGITITAPHNTRKKATKKK